MNALEYEAFDKFMSESRFCKSIKIENYNLNNKKFNEKYKR